MKLKQLLQGLEYSILSGDPEMEISGIHYDSRKVTPGSLFVCITGFQTDGHLFAEQAVEKGAVAVLGERKIESTLPAAQVITGNSRKALAVLASNYYGKPSQRMQVIGVTGTNGKTTATQF